MRTETGKQQDYVQGLLKRLAWQYLEGTPLPSREGDMGAKKTLSLDQLWRLWRHVRSEGYGE
jgi:hypothetical protein